MSISELRSLRKGTGVPQGSTRNPFELEEITVSAPFFVTHLHFSSCCRFSFLLSSPYPLSLVCVVLTYLT